MKKILIMLNICSTICYATNFEPHSYTFKCPANQKIDLIKPILVGVGTTPKMIGQCWWINPTTSFSISPDNTAVTGQTLWELDGPVLSSGCNDVKSETIVANGVITAVSCSY